MLQSPSSPGVERIAQTFKEYNKAGCEFLEGASSKQTLWLTNGLTWTWQRNLSLPGLLICSVIQDAVANEPLQGKLNFFVGH